MSKNEAEKNHEKKVRWRDRKGRSTWRRRGKTKNKDEKENEKKY